MSHLDYPPERAFSVGDRNPAEEWRTVQRLSAVLFAVSLVVAGIAWSLLQIRFIDRAPRLAEGMIAGLAVATPLLAGLWVLSRSRGNLSRQLWEVPTELLGPALSRSSQAGLAGLALTAGIGEELVFRGVLQTWLSPAGLVAALVLPNVLFGLLHYVNATYAIAAGITGLYFSFLLEFVPNVSLYSLMVAHAFYDYVALNCLASKVRSRGRTPESQAADGSLSPEISESDQPDDSC